MGLLTKQTPHAAALKRLETVHKAYAMAADDLERLQAELQGVETAARDGAAAAALGEASNAAPGAVEAAQNAVEAQRGTVQGLHGRLCKAAADELALRADALRVENEAAEKDGATMEQKIADLEGKLATAKQTLAGNVARRQSLAASIAEAERLSGQRVRGMRGTLEDAERLLTDPTAVIDRVELRRLLKEWRAGVVEFGNLHLYTGSTSWVSCPTGCAIAYDAGTGRILEAVPFDYKSASGNAAGVGLPGWQVDLGTMLHQHEMVTAAAV